MPVTSGTSWKEKSIAEAKERIIVTGASGVGKTALAGALAARLGLPVIPEIGRLLCRKAGYDRIGDVPDQEGFKQKVLDAQIEYEERLGSFVSDRSTIDCWVLWQRWNICSAMTFDSETYYQNARKQSEAYTRIIYIPPMFPPPEDGFRWTDPDYQKQIDRLVRTTLYDWDLLWRTHVVQSEGIDKRTDEVLTWLSH